MRSLRKILFPFSLVYGLITWIRNTAYDRGLLKSLVFPVPVIAVGNLSVGGTGKSPMIEYLVRLLQPNHEIAVLSRGYGRKTTGFLMAGKESGSEHLGDEPLQFARKFRNITVAVDEKRARGIRKLLDLRPGTDVILLDDAFQHRQVRAGMYLLLTAYDQLYSDDSLLPSGNLREGISGARRADVIVVTKCPEGMDGLERASIVEKLKPESNQTVFFSKITYHDHVVNELEELPLSSLCGQQVLLVTGIADASHLETFLGAKGIAFRHFRFADHRRLDQKDIHKILDQLDAGEPKAELVLTTEKDFVRNFEGIDERIYYLPIRSEFLADEEDFKTIICNYVRENQGNG